MTLDGPGKKPRIGRKMGLRGVTFTRDDGETVRIGGVKKIVQWLGPGGRVHCLIETMDVDLAKSLAYGATGRRAASFREIYTGKVDPEPTDFGRFRVTGPLLFSGSAQGLGSAKLRMVEEPAAVAARTTLIESSIVMVEGCPADKTTGEGSYRHFFFDDRGRPNSG